MIPLLATARFPPPEFSETGHPMSRVASGVGTLRIEGPGGLLSLNMRNNVP